MTGQYRIVKSQLPLIGGTAGHNLIAVLDENGKVIHELNGLATSKDLEIKPIGYLPSDKLIVYNEKEAKGFYYQPDQKQTVLFTGSYEQVMEKFNLGYKVGQEINKLNLQYPFLGVGPTKGGWAENSNSVASTLLYGMGLQDPDLGWSLTPGEGDLLLPKEKIDEIIRSYQNKKVSSLENGQEQPQYAQAAPAFNLDSLPKPFQNLYPKIQEHLTAYHEKYGIPIDDAQKHNAAVALSALAYSETMGKRQDVPLLFNIKDGQYLIGERNPGLIKTSMEMEQALSLPVEHSLNRVQEITRQFEQQELERQMARQQSRGMSMG